MGQLVRWFELLVPYWLSDHPSVRTKVRGAGGSRWGSFISVTGLVVVWLCGGIASVQC